MNGITVLKGSCRVCLIIVSVLICSTHIVFGAFEQQGTLSAKSILIPELLIGPNHQVDDEVQNDGLLNSYVVRSPFGLFSVTSTSSLRILINEIGAIAAMRQVQTDDTAIASLKQSGENTITGIKNLFVDPQGTLEGAASGVSSLFNRASNTVGRREITNAEDSKVEQIIGLTKSKGHIATQYGVSMYSRNVVLQEELNRLAKADYLGGLGVGVATSFVPGVGGLILTTSGTARLLNEAINTTPASQLWLDNKNKLLALGVDEGTTELFLNNPHFSPALQTVMVAALYSMSEVENRNLYVTIGLQAADPIMAKTITETAVLTAGYHKNIQPLKKLIPLARMACGIKEDGAIVIILPTDHIIWTEAAMQNVKYLEKYGSGGEAWVVGDFSPLAEQELRRKGWKLHTKVREQIIPPDEK